MGIDQSGLDHHRQQGAIEEEFEYLREEALNAQREARQEREEKLRLMQEKQAEMERLQALLAEKQGANGECQSSP